ncbi:2Fe-2S iron-sulfur cluster-binding protein [Patulibacter minatonensis]|uniref:2Fe-2S iron-sulfur cluster-binding protein n=1 Tax=Patulibacter minatonensis TaxID=298163 RepID=UPI00047E4551|nr:2Fe-2S iron-sulfur cluster-binding protein [Patulibacter minatonensis]
MPTINFIDADGVVTSAQGASGNTVMDIAVAQNVPGIVAECGGSCSCATCHVHLDPEWAPRVPEPDPEETDLLEFLEGADERSRLSCQLVISDELDGITVHVASN